MGSRAESKDYRIVDVVGHIPPEDAHVTIARLAESIDAQAVDFGVDHSLEPMLKLEKLGLRQHALEHGLLHTLTEPLASLGDLP